VRNRWVEENAGVTDDPRSRDRDSAELREWHYTGQDLQTQIDVLQSFDLDPRLQMTLMQATETMGRLLRRAEEVERLRRKFTKRAKGRDWTLANKAMFFEATEYFYFVYYSMLSAFASVVARSPQVYGHGVPVRSMEQFLPWLGKRTGLDHFARYLERARFFRTMLDHPQSQQPYVWALAYGDGAAHIFLYGTPSRNGAIPPQATTCGKYLQILPEGNWVLPAPDERAIIDMLGMFFLHATADLVAVLRGEQPPAEQIPVNGDAPFAIEWSEPHKMFRIPKVIQLRWPFEVNDQGFMLDLEVAGEGDWAKRFGL
jgi:hypothetical protein